MKNWSGSVSCSPIAVERPKNVAELRALLRRAASSGMDVRAIGAAHSFTPVAATDGMLVSLDAMSGVESLDTERREVTVFAGTRLYEIGPALALQGWSMENLGDIDRQSVAGVTATGSHGTGRTLGCISTQISGFEMVTADGSILWCDANENPEVFAAGRIALGLLGIITRVRIRIIPRINLHEKRSHLSVEEAIARSDELTAAHRSFEFFWFPFSGAVATKAMDVTPDPPNVSKVARYIDEVILENGVYAFATKVARRVPAVVPALNRLSARVFGSGSKIDVNYACLATQRLVRFNEMEYALPAEHGADALRELIDVVEGQRMHVIFPVECRWVAADDIWLSPAYGRDVMAISIHQLQGMPYDTYFSAAEKIFRRYGGRPHWGKIHNLTTRDLREIYPRFDDFVRLRARMDPDSRFLTPYLRTLFT